MVSSSQSSIHLEPSTCYLNSNVSPAPHAQGLLFCPRRPRRLPPSMRQFAKSDRFSCTLVCVFCGCLLTGFALRRACVATERTALFLYIQQLLYTPLAERGRSTSAATKSHLADWQRKRTASLLRAFATAASMPPYANPLNNLDFCCTKPHFKVLRGGRKDCWMCFKFSAVRSLPHLLGRSAKS